MENIGLNAITSMKHTGPRDNPSSVGQTATNFSQVQVVKQRVVMVVVAPIVLKEEDTLQRVHSLTCFGVIFSLFSCVPFYCSGMRPMLFHFAVVMLGGEGPINPTDVSTHFCLPLYAQQFGAMIISLEHRFYGASQPLPNTSDRSLEFLTSQVTRFDWRFLCA